MIGLSSMLLTNASSRNAGPFCFATLPCLGLPIAIIAFYWILSAPERNEAARIGRGECPFCGYRLANLSATPTEHGGGTLNLVACPECGRWNSVK
jgi:hypothetical protein